MRKSIRFIQGKEYLLAGRVNSKENALKAKQSLLKKWQSVRIIKYWQYDYGLFVHGYTPQKRND